MNTEEKAKAYDEALEQAKKELRTDLHESGVWALKRIFPELADSEDERIRKEIIDYLGLVGKGKGDYAQPMIDRWIAYLEKQKDQKPLSTEETELNSIAFLEQMGYTCIPQGAKPAEWSEDKFPKDIEKDATQFCFDKGFNITPYQAKEIATHYLMIGHNFGYVEGRKNAHIPAKELGLPSSMDFKQEWSDEDEKIMQTMIKDGDLKPSEVAWLKSRRPQPKVEWSENDERMLSRCVKSIESSKQFADADTFKKAKDNEIDWLKNRLKFLCPVKQEWSEEDEKNRRNLMSLLANMRGDRITEETYQKYYPWLKDLRSRPKPSDNWKPSDEQIKALYCALNDAISLYSDKVSPLYEEISRTHFDALESLYNDLKKLM